MKYIRTPNPKREKSHIPFRLNLLFFVVFLLFAALVAQLGYLQIMNGSKFAAEVDRNDTATVTGNVPRGIITDSKGRALVQNQANNAITYTKGLGVKASQMRETADRLATMITVPETQLHDRDYADYYLADEAVAEKINKQLPEKLQASKDYGAVYAAQVAAAQKVMPHYTDAQKPAIALYKIMNGATQLTTVYLKNRDVTAKEVAVVGEHLTEMPGVNLGTDWARHYPNGDSMTSIIGTVSSEKSGLPADDLNVYLANGYARNDRVGTSYLEQRYENVLKGAKSRTQVEIGNNNDIVAQVEQFKGLQGANLQLTIDSAYQKLVDEAVSTQFAKARQAGITGLSDGMYAVAMNPKTGAILAIAGWSQDAATHELNDDALGVLNRAFTMGSVVKPAMVLGALNEKVITPADNVLPDVPIYLPGTPAKKSVYPIGTYGALDAASALEVSSNIYMMRLAMKEGRAKYVPETSMVMDDDIFVKMRQHFAAFGLGQTTGVDLPGEVSGLFGPTINYGQLAVGSALDLSYGNFDGYTLMQVAQYVSTIANNGYRMKPYIVSAIQQTLSDGSNGPTLETTQPTVASRIPNTQAEIDVVKQGMWQVTHGTKAWTTASGLKTIEPGLAAKTGTAQTFKRVNPEDLTSKLEETVTSSFIGYAPANDPKIAIAIVMPNVSDDGGTYTQALARSMVEGYYKLNDIKGSATKKQPASN